MGVYFRPNICKVRPQYSSSYIVFLDCEVRFWPLGVQYPGLHLVYKSYHCSQLPLSSYVVLDFIFCFLLCRCARYTKPNAFPSLQDLFRRFSSLGSWSRIVQPFLPLTFLLACTSIDSALVKSLLAPRYTRLNCVNCYFLSCQSITMSC